jgi:hypothetical protein
VYSALKYIVMACKKRQFQFQFNFHCNWVFSIPITHHCAKNKCNWLWLQWGLGRNWSFRELFWIEVGRPLGSCSLQTCNCSWQVWCVLCKRRDVQSLPPIMTSLPAHRLTPFLPAFAYTAVFCIFWKR